MRRRPARLAHHASFLFLIALGFWFIDILWVADVQAITFTSSSSVDMFLVDQYPQGGSVGGVKFGPPDQSLIDLSLSEMQTTNKTLFGVSSVTAFVNTDGSLLSSQGVAQVDTLLSPVGLSPASLVTGHARLELRFTGGDSPFFLPHARASLEATLTGFHSAISRLSFTPSCPPALERTRFKSVLRITSSVITLPRKPPVRVGLYGTFRLGRSPCRQRSYSSA